MIHESVCISRILAVVLCLGMFTSNIRKKTVSLFFFVAFKFLDLLKTHNMWR